MKDMYEAAVVYGPRLGHVAVFDVSPSAMSVDLSIDTAVGQDMVDGRTLRLHADGCDVYYLWSTDGTTAIDDLATSGDARCDVILAGAYSDEHPPYTGVQACRFLHYKAPAGGVGHLRITSSSNNRANLYK